MPKVSVIPWIIKKLKGAIGIVEDTDTAVHAIASGKYVVWKGTLCKTTATIAIGDTLSAGTGGNLDVVDDGGLNDVNGNIPAVYNGLDSTSTTSALSAAQGKELNSKITNKFDNTAIQTVDFNSIKDTCVIRTTGSSTNYPSEVASGSGILATFDGLSGSAVLQFFQFDNTRLFKRQYWYGTWSAWQELAINNKITFTLTVPSGWTFNNNGCYKVGRIVCIIGSFATTNGTSEKTITFSNAIPSDFRPDIRVDFAGFNNSTDRVLHGIASSNGNIVFYRQETENITNIAFSLTYIL